MGLPGGLLDHARKGDRGADRFITMIAAGGSLAAQRDLLTLLVGDPARLEDRQLDALTFEEVVRVEILARFCALRGDAFDIRRLAGVLHRMAETATRSDDRAAFAFEAAELLRTLADEGDGQASELLVKLVGEFPEARPIVALADAALLPKHDAPPPIIRSPQELALGDILAEAFAYEPRTGFLGFIERVRFALSDLGWSIRRRWWALKDRLGWA